MSVERSEGVLCLVGAETLPTLEAEIGRILHFMERSSGLRLIDVVYTATRDALGKQCTAGLWVTSVEEMLRKLKVAQEALQRGRTRLRDKSGVFFTTDPLARRGGKVAFVFPGTGSFHLEMMRDLALTFDGVRQRFDDMEEAFAGFCDVASPSEWLFSTSPEHTLPLEASRTFLPLLASASTYLASKVFADLLRTVGVRPDAVGGVGLGAFSAFHATHHDPRMRLVQILRDAGKMLLRLGSEMDEPWTQLTVSGAPTDALAALAAQSQGRLAVSERLTAESCILAAAPEWRERAEAAVRENGGLSVAEPLFAHFNTGRGDAQMRRQLGRFFGTWVGSEPQRPFFSCVTGRTIEPSVPSVVGALVDQMMLPLDFEAMIRGMYAAGCRIFVEVGARGLMSPVIAKVLEGCPEPVATIPMHILHRSGGVQVGQALGLLAAQGVPVDYLGLRFFDHARRLDFEVPVAGEASAQFSLRLSRELPALRPERLDVQRFLEPPSGEAEEDGRETHSHDLPPALRAGGQPLPLLRGAQTLRHAAGLLELACTFRLEDIPYLNDYAIGTAGVSHRNPQMRGLTLFAVPAGLEAMAECAKMLLPEMPLLRIDRLRAPRWLAFRAGRLALRLTAEAGVLGKDGTRRVRVQIRPANAVEEESVRPALEAHFLFGPAIPEPLPPEPAIPLVASTPVAWSAEDIYPARLFQGPLLRNVRRVTGWGLNGIDYEVRIPSRANLVRGAEHPLFATLPLLLDAAVSGFPLWRSHERFHGAISLPFRCRCIRYYAAWVPEGTRLRCTLRVTNATARSVQVDILASDAQGHPILDIRGWEEVSDRAERPLHDFVMHPARNFITQPLPASLLPEGAEDVVGAIYVNAKPDFFVSNQELWLNALAAAVLTPDELENFHGMGAHPHRRLEWLLGRTAAKEAVRRLLFRNHALYEPSADIAIWKDRLGKPHPVGAWQAQLSVPVDLSIAHTSGLVLAAATSSGRIGFDVEAVTRDLTEEFLRAAFALEEQELAAKSGDGPTAVLRFWCAKEAISKALGTGLRFAPADLRIRESDPATGVLKMELLEQWAEQFPVFRGRRLAVKTCVRFGHAIAACLLPHFDSAL